MLNMLICVTVASFDIQNKNENGIQYSKYESHALLRRDKAIAMSAVSTNGTNQWIEAFGEMTKR